MFATGAAAAFIVIVLTGLAANAYFGQRTLPVFALLENAEGEEDNDLCRVNKLMEEKLDPATRTYLERSEYTEAETIAIAQDPERQLSEEITGIGPMRAADIHAAIFSGYEDRGMQEK